MCLVYNKLRKTKAFDLRKGSPTKDFKFCVCVCVCVCGKPVSDVKDEKCFSEVFTHAAGSSISGNISHSASLTPSALLQYPHIFPFFLFFSLHPPLLTFNPHFKLPLPVPPRSS
ncbi:hypothetical protein CHARACLAT_002525 [Characodon lateralis]|uniref:Uncharacterized protein n=1 Tax=Characodon lateralis TaxID=208331 RepID=A0ABU7E6L3_9TELE|nr:hypothetical protein [Characodon lateralis]